MFIIGKQSKKFTARPEMSVPSSRKDWHWRDKRFCLLGNSERHFCPEKKAFRAYLSTMQQEFSFRHIGKSGILFQAFLAAIDLLISDLTSSEQAIRAAIVCTAATDMC